MHQDLSKREIVNNSLGVKGWWLPNATGKQMEKQLEGVMVGK